MSATEARRAAALLRATETKVVFAESCTGGLVSGALTRIAGISSYHCGAMVVYRNETKHSWLRIPEKLLDKPGPVSETVAILMAQRVLDMTPEAEWAVSVTGHLGPGAPPRLDGVAFTAVAARGAEAVCRRLTCRKLQGRSRRQQWVIRQVLSYLCERLEAARP